MATTAKKEHIDSKTHRRMKFIGPNGEIDYSGWMPFVESYFTEWINMMEGDETYAGWEFEIEEREAIDG